jgi:hypothetical protein
MLGRHNIAEKLLKGTINTNITLTLLFIYKMYDGIYLT